MLEQNNTPKEKHGVSSKAIASPKNSRRSFLTKAAIAAPLLTTITSRPVWAGICSLSGNLSNNVSNHDHPEDCQLNIYSPGGWLCGSAKNLWGYTDYSQTDTLSSLLGSLLDGVTPDDITIEQALSGNGQGGGNNNCNQVGGEYSATGWERQLACAALNALLWQKALMLCEGNPNCGIMDDLADNFYFPFTLQDIRDIYHAGTSIYDWEAIQNID